MKIRFFILTIINLALIIRSFAYPISEYEIKKQSLGINDTIVIYDTVYVYDTIYTEEPEVIFDSLIHFKVTPAKFKPIETKAAETLIPPPADTYFRPYQQPPAPVFSAGVNFSLNYPHIKLSAPPALDDFKTALNISLSPLMGFSGGFEFNYHRKQINFTSGFNYTNVKLNFNHTDIETHIDSIFKYQYFNRTEIEFDTIWFVNIDTLIASGDTLWVPYIDTNYVNHLDSTLIFTSDTSQTLYPVQNINTIKYLEIPLIISLPVKLNRYKLNIEFGIIPAIIMNSSGKIVSLVNYNGSVDINKTIKMNPVMLSGYAGLSAFIPINMRFQLETKFFIKNNLTSIYSNYPVSQRHRTTGFQFGLLYKFNL